MRVQLQSEAGECGLACLSMVAAAHGADHDLPDLRRRFPVSLKGANLRQLVAHAAALNFASRPLRLALDELGQLQRPCILHWGLNHFVVLKQAGRRHVVILDPAIGERRLSLAEASRHFTGVALELTPNADFLAVMQANFPTDTKLVVACKAGGRSMKAAQTLVGAGYTTVVDQRAGWSGAADPFGKIAEPGWSAAGLPTATTPAAGHAYAELLEKKA